MPRFDSICNIFHHRLSAALAVLVLGAALLPAVRAQDPNVCDQPGESPDVIVGDLHEVQRYGTLNGITGFSVGTVSCNIGTCWLNWISSTNQHPVIAQNMYRLKDGRFEQIGMGWLKHGFFALSNTLCSTGCIGTNGSHLGVNCSDPYSAGLNGSQGGLGPRFEVNPWTGEFLYPFTFKDVTGDVIYKRLQVHNVDLDPNLNAGARYFVEGHYITNDDAIAGKHFNNASHREVLVSGANPTFSMSLIGETKRELPAINAWNDADPSVKVSDFNVQGEGRFLVGYKATSLGGGVWHYEYAVHNLNSQRAGGMFRVPVPAGAVVTNIGFHDVDYHSGEPFDGTDWVGVHDTLLNQVVWATQSYAENPNANALRWGTLYNFRFDANAAPVFGTATVDLFMPGDPASVSGPATVPNPCNLNGICEPGETCTNCAADCVNQGPSVGVCGDGVCEPTIGEDCLSCPGDCRGQQSGNPGQRFCCGDGDGENPIGCNDSRCQTSGFTCGSTNPSVCCGNGTCEVGENSCICPSDCGPPPLLENQCGNGSDDDCDGLADCDDFDCCAEAACNDGIDGDGDGVIVCDCNDTNPQIWSTPGRVPFLDADREAGSPVTLLSWGVAVPTGGTVVEYDVLRTANPGVWSGTTASCLSLADPTQTSTTDVESPTPGNSWNYLVRAVNDCPDGTGPLGDETTPPRDGRTCP